MGINIIVVTGLTRRGKDITPGWLISKWLRCPSVFLEPIFLRLIRQAGAAERQETNDHHEQLLSTALDFLFHQASYIVPTVDKYSNRGCIVLEFPLSSVLQLEELIKVVTNDGSRPKMIDRVLIVECIAQQRTWWTYLSEKKLLPVWYDHHVQRFADPEKAIEQQHQLISSVFDGVNNLKLHDDDGGRLVSILNNRVSKLDVDFIMDYIPANRTYGSRQWHPGTSDDRLVLQSIPLFEALEYLLFKRDYVKDGPLSFTMREWGQIKLDLNLPRSADGKSALCYKGLVDHDIVVHRGRRPHPADDDDYLTQTAESVSKSFAEYYYCCGLCEDLVVGDCSPYYCCASCPLILHKACAELELDLNTFRPVKRTEVALRDYRYELSDPTTYYACKSCKEAGKMYLSQKCRGCLFDTFLKRRFRPVVIRHPFFSGEDDFLQIQILRSEDLRSTNRCAACGCWIEHGISYFHKRSSLVYGLSCLAQVLMPVEKLNVNHHGYTHPLRLMKNPHQELDNYICDVCWKERDSQHWYYYCDECDFTSHVYCICPVEEGVH